MNRKEKDETESEAFLPEDRDVPKSSVSGSTWKPAILIHATLIITYTIVFVIAALPVIARQGEAQLSQINFTLAVESKYAGPRTDGTDRAWAELLRGINVRVQRHELSPSSETPVELPDGGYLAWPEAMHQVHCVKRIREWFYQDQYLPDIDEKAKQHWIVHVDHCIELLRQSVMCNPDPAWMGFHWEQANERPTLNLRGPEHQCVVWEDYVSGVRTRSVSREELGRAYNRDHA